MIPSVIFRETNQQKGKEKIYINELFLQMYVHVLPVVHMAYIYVQTLWQLNGKQTINKASHFVFLLANCFDLYHERT